MVKSIKLNENKTLKLNNVISCRMDMDEKSSFEQEINKMRIYIQLHGARPVGPLIQFTKVILHDDGNTDVDIEFFLQSNRFIHNVEAEFKMDAIMKVKNCLYARYVGPEDKIKFAYDKLGVYAFENDIELDGSNYTIYVDRNEEEETMVADVFMPIKE